MVDLKLLIKNGVQWGHQTPRWNPKMERFIWGTKGGVHLINVEETAKGIERAGKFLEDVAAQGKQILWVGTKSSASDAVQAAAEQVGSPYVRNRWIGGTLTNFSQVKKSVTKLLHHEDIVNKSDKYNYTKKEFGVFQKIVDRLESNVGGIRSLVWPVGALVVVDVKKEAVAIKEARAMGVPVVALVDTNSDPSGIDYVIPGNDDVARAVKIVVDELATAAARGAARTDKKQQKVAEVAGAEDALLALKRLEEDEEGAPKKGGVVKKLNKVIEEVVIVEEAPSQKPVVAQAASATPVAKPAAKPKTAKVEKKTDK
jgi:small subunit ribosomal protein S2